MNELLVKDEIKIENLIYEIRGKQVMLDSDLAKLYKCTNGTKTINLAVKRHINRFPERFMFQLKKEETLQIYPRFQTETLDNSTNLRGSNIKYLPYVFTEQGVAMLATILRTSVAEQVSIEIMDAFVSMRKYISNNLIEQKYINNLVFKHDEDIKLLQQSFNALSTKVKNNHIFFEGQIFDAYSKIIDIFNTSKKEVIIIDNYLDKNMVDIISKCNNKILLVTADKLNNIDLIKYRKQYNNLTVCITKNFHDRFIIIDRHVLYHLGSSLNSIGYKCFAISKIEETDMLEKIIKKLEL